jgi:hypothetical protein
MATRAEALNSLQIGKETTPGTAVACSKIIRSLRPRGPEVTQPVGELIGTGALARMASVVGKGNSVIQLEGMIPYGEALYLLAMHYKQPATTGANPYTHVFTPALSTPNVIDTCTIQVGSTAFCEQLTYCFCPELRFAADMQRTTASATIIGRMQTEGATITPTPTEIAAVVGGPAEWTWSDAAESATPSYTAMRALACEFTSTVRWGPLFTSEAAQASFSDVVEFAPEIMMSLTLERTANAVTLLGYKTPQTTRMCQFLLTSVTTPNVLKIEMPYRVVGDPQQVEEQGVRALRFPLKCFYGLTAGFFVKTTLINVLATL